jgi:hypothetical protein
VLAVMLGAIVAIGLTSLFGQIASEGADARAASGVLALILAAALAGMLVFDLHEVVSTLMADSDLELLRRAPIRRSRCSCSSSPTPSRARRLLLLVMAVPGTFAYHLFYPLPAWGWLVFRSRSSGCGRSRSESGPRASILLLRQVSPRRARETLGLLSTLTLFALWLANSFLLPRLAGTGADPYAPLRSAIEGGTPIDRISPGRWVANAIGAAATGDFLAALRWTAVLLVVALLSLALSASIASRHLEVAQSAVAGGTGIVAAVAENARRRTGSVRARSFLETVLRRDLRLFLRDWTVLGDVLTTAILWTLLPLLGTPLYHVSSHAIARAMLLALTVGLGYEVGARMLPFERRGIAWVRLGPVPASRWIAAKLAGAAALSLPLMAVAATSMMLALDLGARETIEALALAVPALGLALAVGLWTGARFGRADWTNPRAMLDVTGRAAATLLLLVQAAGWLVLAAWADARRETLAPGVMLWAPALAAITLAILPLRSAAGTLARRDWNA